jgi:hypothetical protein
LGLKIFSERFLLKDSILKDSFLKDSILKDSGFVEKSDTERFRAPCMVTLMATLASKEKTLPKTRDNLDNQRDSRINNHDS